MRASHLRCSAHSHKHTGEHFCFQDSTKLAHKLLPPEPNSLFLFWFTTGTEILLKQTQYLQSVRRSSQDEEQGFRVRFPGCAVGFLDTAAVPLS